MPPFQKPGLAAIAYLAGAVELAPRHHLPHIHPTLSFAIQRHCQQLLTRSICVGKIPHGLQNTVQDPVQHHRN